jgi:YesN/AraC family two-component response regulator
LERLTATFTELRSKLDTLNQDAIRNREFDFEILTQDELKQKLLKGTRYENRQLVLTQIGYLRINLFQEYYERIQAAEESQDLDKAVQLMNQYILTIAMPFIQERIHPSILTRIANIFSTSTLPNAAQTLKEWQTHHEAWNRQKKANIDKNQKAIEFGHIKNLFITLYTLSFSPSNFPPVAVEPSH